MRRLITFLLPLTFLTGALCWALRAASRHDDTQTTSFLARVNAAAARTKACQAVDVIERTGLVRHVAPGGVYVDEAAWPQVWPVMESYAVCTGGSVSFIGGHGRVIATVGPAVRVGR